MTLLDRYLLRTILASVALVVLVLLVLGTLFMFIQQQDDIGVGNFGAASAMFYVLLSLPQQMVEVLPIAALIGALLGLGSLARGSELIAMRAAGLSVARIAVAATMAGIVLAVLALVVGEYLAPPMQQLARQTKAFGKFDNVSFARRGGAWVRDGNLIINVDQQSAQGEFPGMLVFELSANHDLVAMGRATKATPTGEDRWTLADYAESRFAGDYVSGRTASTRDLTSDVARSFLGITVSDPRDIDLRSLARVIGGLQGNNLDARNYEFAFWTRVARFFAIVFAVLLAVPFVFGTLRSSGAGARTLLGLVLGITFFLLQRMLESGAIVFDAPPAVLAWLPTALLAFASLVLIARTR